MYDFEHNCPVLNVANSEETINIAGHDPATFLKNQY